MQSQKKIAILGSTGSIGKQALDVAERFPELLHPEILIAGSNAGLLASQAKKFRPSQVVIADESKYKILKEELSSTGTDICAGADAIADVIRDGNYSMLLNATVGYSGLRPTLAAIEGGKDIALANKESLVVAGSLVISRIKAKGLKLNPVDSEHSAVWQCLAGENPDSIRRLIITASGGPFRTFTPEQLRTVTVKDALRHPNWNMGAKITIDSATMMNKAFELIEAYWLFGIPAERIEAIVHPQSVIHSMIEFADGAVKAQLGVPDMRLPIRYALADGIRLDSPEEHLDFTRYQTLTFEKPDITRFPCLGLAEHCLKKGGTEACAVNAANEAAVAAFLHEEIRFTDIYPLIRATAAKTDFIENPGYEDFVAINSEARKIAAELIASHSF